MKKVSGLLAVAVLTLGLTGCNNGWPRMFCNDCTYDAVYEDCDPCTSYYGGETDGGGWVSEPTPAGMDTVPVPGPAERKAS